MRRILLIGLLIAAYSLALAQTDAGHVENTVDGTIGVQKQTQKEQDAWAKEQAELETRYRNAKAQIAYLNDRKAVEQKKADALTDRVNELQRRLDESLKLEANLQDTLRAVMNHLESWVNRDLPFLMSERSARIAGLKDELARPEVTGAEKLRRILEALQIEANYGGTVEVVQDEITVGSEKLFVDLLRIGRVSVFWRTPDGNRVGEYDVATRKWVELPDSYSRTLGRAMDMAMRIRPTELIALPLGRIQP